MKSIERVLVTGGAGFLGSHLCDRLLDDGHEVICLDNFYTGTKANILHMTGNPRFELLRHDVSVPVFVEVDYIYNLACAASPVHYQSHPVQTLKASVMGVMNMLEIARQRPHVRVLQASTSEVYGDPKSHPQQESYLGNVNPIGPRACYDEGKRCAETLCFDYHRQYGANIKVARIFNTYGERMLAQDGRVVSNFILQALRGEDITLYGEGTQTRSFCYHTDMIDALVRLMHTPHTVTGPVNLGNPYEITIRELAETIIRLTGSRSKLVLKPLPADDPTRRCPDITLAKKELHWEPKVALEEGLKRTIEYFRSRMNANNFG